MASDGFTARWTDKNTMIFVTLMVEEVKKGNRRTCTFSKKEWKGMKDEFYKQTGLVYTLPQLKNKMNKLRNEYSSFKKLLSISGFGWNPVLKTATTEDASLWDVHVKENSQWEKFRRMAFRIGSKYQEDEHVLNDELFAPDPVETPNPVLHRQDRTPNAKRRRRSGNADYSMACQAMHDLVKLRQNQYDNNIANSATAKVNEDPYSIEVAMDVLNDMVGLEDEEYSKAAKHVVESQAWRVAFIKALPERRAILMAGAPHIDEESIDEDIDISNFFIIISNNSIHTKEPIRDSRLTGAEWVLELRFGHSDRIYEAFRMERFVFNKLCTLMIQKGWNVCERFQRSGQTISKYFSKVLTAMLQLAHEIIKPPPLDMVPMEIRDNPKHFPYFKVGIPSSPTR
ncbi:hypothetical protein K1719_020614 [Acacia pycnantha]|nr:hypothetical protein K1719_020614 [Acacia pycnantha]